ncbi:hypothetical protein NLU13_1100 [Sarocladium strictum]|uniref:Uncharacterized protein n=1 Tax=Sarocladium strictum TaxID=5046 RepID=A0AA39GQB3_SARSR|nr:hypothetical protein NLU13_1100 [Sarocladium strictum]
MLTPMEYNGDIVYPAKDLPPAVVYTEELEACDGWRTCIEDHGRAMVALMRGASDEPSGDTSTQPAPGTTQDIALAMGFAAWRMGTLGAYDGCNVQLLDKTAIEGITDVDKATRNIRSIALAAIEEGVDAGDNPITEPGTAALGLAQVRRIIEDDHTGGLAEIYRHLRVDRDILALALPA